MSPTARPSLRLVNGRELAEGTIREMVGALEAAFGPWPAHDVSVTAAAHLRWKLEGPSDDGTLVALNEARGRVVGFTTRVPRRIAVRGKVFAARWTADSCMHPEFAGMGLMGERWEALERRDAELGFSFSLGSTNHPALERLLRDRIPVGSRLRILFLPLSVHALVAEHARRSHLRMPAPLQSAGIRAMSLAQRVRYPRYARPQLTPDWSIRSIERFDESVGELYEELASSFDLIQMHDHHSLNWRYRDPRSGAFTVLAAEGKGRFLGYTVTKTEGARGYIAELVAAPGRLDVARALAESALTGMREKGVAEVMCWMATRHPYMTMMKRLGFIDSRRETGFYIKPTAGAIGELTNVLSRGKQIHIVHGDTDVV